MGAAITDYVGQRVEVRFTHDALDGESDPNQRVVVGKVENANAIGFVFKPAGSSKSRLYQVDHIETIQMAPEAEPVLKARRLDPANLKNVKRHLVDRHGYTLTDINEMTPERALEFHDSMDHTEQDLSHFHAEAKPKAGQAEQPAPGQNETEPESAEESPAPEATPKAGDQEFLFSDDEPDF